MLFYTIKKKCGAILFRFVLLLCTLFTLNNCAAQSFSIGLDARFENFNGEHHFINNFIGNATIDADGYLWSCSDGLYRFDGVSFTHFTDYNNQQHGLKSNYNDDLLTDKWGRLWIGTIGGLCFYNKASNQFRYINHNSANRINFAFAFCMAGNNMWFVSNVGLCKIDLINLKVSETTLKNVLDPIKTIQVNDSTLLVSARECYYLYNIKNNTFNRKTLSYKNKYLRISAVEKKTDSFWVSTNKGLWTGTNLQEDLHHVAGTENLSIRDMLCHPADKNKIYLWLATSNGLQLYNTVTHNNSYNFLHDDANPYSLQANSLNELFTDANENLWICTDKGISLFNYKNQAYKTRFISLPDKVTDDFIRCMRQDISDSNKVFISCEVGGILQYNWYNKQLVRQYVKTGYKHDNIPADVLDMQQLSKNEWLLLTSQQLVKWDAVSGRVTAASKFKITKDILPSLRFNKIIPTGNQQFFVTSNRGLFHYNANSKQFNEVLSREAELKQLSFFDMTNATFDGKETIWIAARKGLVQYDVQKNKALYYYNAQYKDSNLVNFLNDVAIGDRGNIYCAHAQGVSVFDTNKKSFKNITLLNKQTDPACYSLISKNGLLWINSNAGLIIFNPKKATAQVYNFGNIYTPSFSVSNFEQIRQNLIIPFRHAYAYFDPSLFFNTAVPSPPLLEALFVNNQPFNNDSNNAQKLTYDQNNIRFAFTAFDFNNPEKVRFRYRLQGIDKDWIYTTGERTANYIQLLPASYTFLLQAGNQDGNWNNVTQSVHFKIAPAFWKTTTFKIAVALLLVLALGLVFSNRLSQIKKQAALKQVIAQTEMKALRAQMNPHFIFNCLATADGYIMQNKRLEASIFLTKFSKLIRMVLENSQHALVLLQTDIAALKLYLQLEQVRHQHKFTYEIIVAAAIETEQLCIPPLLIQPYIENAILHGLRHKSLGDGWVKIAFEVTSENLICIIEDNGVGRQRAAAINLHQPMPHQSMGMSVTVNRIDSIQLMYNKKATAQIIDKPDQSGTIVKIILPLFSNYP